MSHAAGTSGQNQKPPVIVIAAGGTGGHIFPAIATGAEIARLRPDAQVIYACGERPLEVSLYERNGIKPVIFPARQIRSGITGKVFGVAAAAANVWRARAWIRQIRADLAVGFGGYVAGPTVLGAKLAGCKTAIHEANSIPGRTNRILGRMMDLTATHFQSTLSTLGGRRRVAVGMPIRPLVAAATKSEARVAMGLAADVRTLLVMGGSQGARYLYQRILQQLPLLDSKISEPLQILWSTGESNYDELVAGAADLQLQKLTLHLTPFISDMGNALKGADIAVARAGASALAELIAFRVYTVFVPFPGAIYNHQMLNAQEAERYGLGSVLPENEVGERFVESVLAGLEHVDSLPGPPENLDSRLAASRLAEMLLALAE